VGEDIRRGCYPVTGVVLAGGSSRRLGFNKAFAEVGGKPIIERALAVLESLFDEVFIVALDAELYEKLDSPVYTDLLPGNGALGGVHAALSYASGEASFICACDMPFLNPRLIGRMVESAPGADVVLPRSPKGLEPLHALYGRGCLPAVERAIESGELKLTSYFSQLAVRVVEGEELERLDSGGLSFFNINSAEDLDAARAIARRAVFPPPSR
jgi:molybdopterin-guanine dinucleotide biosynthesis protein A